MDFIELLNRRGAGLGRVAFVNGYRAGLDDAVLVRFGLRPLRAQLRATDRNEAQRRLSGLLARDMAYGGELMTVAEAECLADAFVASVARDLAIFYVNQTVDTHVQMTDATFDAGIIVENPDHTYACIWFEDED